MKLKYLLLWPALCFADNPDPTMLQNDPKRPVKQISQDLNVTEDQFVQCFSKVQPVPQGQQPSGERQHENKAALLPCLQQYNTQLTNDQLDAVMDKYRPQGANGPQGSNGKPQ